MTIEKNCSNQYFVAILFEVQKAVHKIDNRKDAIGMDFSPAEMYINSDGKSGKDLVFCNKKPEHRFRNIFKLLTVDEYNNLKDKENFSVTIPIESQIDIEKNEIFFKC